MAFDSGLTGADEGFEARLAAIGSGPVFCYPILTNVEPQEVKANSTLIGIEGMGEVGFAWFQTQVHLS